MGPVISKPESHVKIIKTAENTVKTKTDGLCRLCKESENCTFSSTEKKNVIHCGEFLPTAPLTGRVTDTGLKAALKSWQQTQKTSELREPKAGLCAYCLEAPHCTYPKKEGGIWNCDEYRED